MSDDDDTKRPYTSRWNPSAAFEPRLTERHIEAFKLLTRYTYLPSPYFPAFLGGHRDSWQEALRNLTGAGYLDRPKQQRQHCNANYRPLVYALGERGFHALRERGIECERPRARRNFAHELMTGELIASFELGAREAGVRLITWSDILKSENLPELTRRSAKPFHMPVTLVADGTRREMHIAADGQPFGIERTDNGRKLYFFCPGVEADCGTEPVDTSDFERSSIYKKLVLYEAIHADGIHRSHFGFPNFYVPMITTNKARVQSMMDLLRRIAGGGGSKIFLFKTFPAFTSFEKPPAPSGRMLTEDWQRVGYPPFNFLTS
jgi:hypothetical protein